MYIQLNDGQTRYVDDKDDIINMDSDIRASLKLYEGETVDEAIVRLVEGFEIDELDCAKITDMLAHPYV